MSTTARGPINILSLDGGGIRGLSSLLLLRGLMERLAIKKAIVPHTGIRPSEYFDLIIGTGTGGISALFLGRMGMTIDEAIDGYLHLAKTAFEPRASNPFALHLWRETSTLHGHALERGIGDIVEKILGDRDAKMVDPTPDVPATCRTAVLAAASANADAPPHVFRSYTSRQPDCQFSIVEVARATLATAGVFKPVSLGTPAMKFIDAAHSGYNNPAEVGLFEAAELWQDSDVGCLVSIGTGLQQVVSVGEGWDQVAKACMSVVQSCELIHDRIFRMRQQAKLPYFRFSVDRGLGSVELMEWKEAQVENLTGTTQSYMEWAEVSNQLNACASVLNGEILSLGHSASTKDSKKFLPLHNPAPAIFHGRGDYVEKAVTMLCGKKQAFLCILGSGGIGKTAIVCTILHDSRMVSKFGDHRFFVSCDGISTSPFLVDTLCAAFGLEHLTADRKDGLLNFLKYKYPTQPLLLVLDNFETVWEAVASDSEALLAALCQVTGLSLVLTMRGAERPADVNWTKPLLSVVEPLSPQAAQQTFMDICEKEDEKLGVLLQELDYVPLAVTLMAHLGQIESPSNLLKRWRNEKTKLLSRKQGRLKNVDVSIQVSLESNRMQSCSEALTLLRLIALLPNGVLDGDLHAIVPKIKTCDWAAQTLCQVGLAYKDSLQTLCVLSPIRAYIVDNYAPNQEMLGDLEMFHFKRAEEGAQSVGKEGHQEFLKVLQGYEGNMEAIIFGALQENKNGNDGDDMLIRKVQAALDWTQILFRYRPRGTIIEFAVQMTQGKEKCYRQHAKCMESLGNIQHVLGNYQQAQEMLFTAQAQFEVIGDEQEAANCLRCLGQIQIALYDCQQAQEMLSTAQDRLEAIGDQHGATKCLQSLANIQDILDNYHQAQNMLFQAKTQFEAIGDQQGATQCLQGLGGIHCALDNYQQAQDFLSTAQKKFEVMGDKLGVAKCLQNLAYIQYMLNNDQQAHDIFSTSKAMFEAIGFQLGVAQCIKNMGNIQQNFNNYQQAQDMLSMAQERFEAIGSQLEAAQCLRSLGHIKSILKEYQQAQDMLSTAQARFEAIGNQSGAAQCLMLLGDTQYMLKNYQQAHDLLSTAHTRFEAIGNQSGVAQCLMMLGDTQFMLKNSQKAQDMISTAHAMFETMGNNDGAAKCLQKLSRISMRL